MRVFRTLLISALFFPLATAARTRTASHGQFPSVLVRLAAKAKSSRTWPELRRYAASRRVPKDKALAYFVLGFREYQAGSYSAAETDLARAASVNTPVADLADYYCASAAYKGGHPERVAGILDDFTTRFPSSMKHYDAIELLAWGYLQTGGTQKALHLLLAVPQVREVPSLALLLAQAYVNNGQLRQAAFIYQDIYYAFPTASQAEVAGTALKKLKRELGVKFPPVSDEIATARVEKLYVAYHFSQALRGYEDLLKTRATSKWAWRWNLGRAKCLIRLGRADDAIDTLVRSYAPTSELDAERLAILVDAYARTDNDTAIAKTITRLSSDHFKSHWHAVALLRAANYFMSKGELQIAPLYYRTLSQLFPHTPEGAQASWRLAWITCLTGKPGKAELLLVSFIKDYPDSVNVPAAIYFLGQLEEKSRPAKARALYELLRDRFSHHYYAVQAIRRLSAMRRERVHQASAGAGSPAYSVATLAGKIPALDPPGVAPCLVLTSHPDLAAFNTLKALHLDHLATQDLQSRLSHHPNSPSVVFALSRFEAEQGRTDLAMYTTRKIAPDYYSQQFSEFPRQIWELLYPRKFTRIIRRYAVANHLDPYLVMGLIREESGFYPRATSPSDARGLMQILPSTVARSRRYRRIAGRRLYGPTYNVRFGCAFLRNLLKRYHGNAAEAVAAYNAGPTRVDEWLSRHSYSNSQEFVESIPFPGTRVYVKGVLADRSVYRQLERGRPEFADCSAHSARRRRRSTALLEILRNRLEQSRGRFAASAQ